MRSRSVSLLATLFGPFADATQLDGSSADLDVELSDASKSVMSGQVSLGMERLKAIFAQTNPSSDRVFYRKVGFIYPTDSYEIEDTAKETQVLTHLMPSNGSIA